ncbi:dihydrofolate reductase [Pseudorhodoferax sp.]|uniref:dihydrofolate reductase n=1 Tax=Pseudorhodoferax sp. TaxID=1993553 RepID=UPI0039E24D3E
MTSFHLIWAQAANGVIGKDNALPWRLPEDMAHFKAVTAGCPVLMGRRTWESLPPKFRPLPGRRNLVLTRQAGWQADGATRVATLDAAAAACAPDARIWVTGGAEVYALALLRASTAVITEIEADFDGDTCAPALGPAWREVARERHVGASGLAFSFVTWRNTAL